MRNPFLRPSGRPLVPINSAERGRFITTEEAEGDDSLDEKSWVLLPGRLAFESMMDRSAGSMSSPFTRVVLNINICSSTYFTLLQLPSILFALFPRFRLFSISIWRLSGDQELAWRRFATRLLSRNALRVDFRVLERRHNFSILHFNRSLGKLRRYNFLNLEN